MILKRRELESSNYGLENDKTIPEEFKQTPFWDLRQCILHAKSMDIDCWLIKRGYLSPKESLNSWKLRYFRTNFSDVANLCLSTETTNHPELRHFPARNGLLMLFPLLLQLMLRKRAKKEADRQGNRDSPHCLLPPLFLLLLLLLLLLPQYSRELYRFRKSFCLISRPKRPLLKGKMKH